MSHDQSSGEPLESELSDENLDAELALSQADMERHLGGTLAELFSAPHDLTSRTTAEVRDALLTRSTLAAGVDLLTLGWHTLRFLSGADEPNTSPNPFLSTPPEEHP